MFFLLLLLFANNKYVLSQIVSGQVFSTKKQGIEFCNITDNKRKIGFVTDSIGKFKLNLSLFQQSDTLIFYSLGYKAFHISKSKLVDDSKIVLEENVLTIDEVQVRSIRKNGKKITLGSQNKRDQGLFGSVLNTNYEFALLINNSDHINGIINKFSFYIHSVGVYNSPFRIRVYENQAGKPGKEITNKNIIVQGYKRGSWNDFDASNFGITFPVEGCFISMEWLNLDTEKYKYVAPMNSSGYAYGQVIGLTREFPKSISYRRQNDGVWFDNELYWEHFKLKNYNPMIRVQVLTF